MKFWISRGRKGWDGEYDVFFEPTKPKDNNVSLKFVCYREFRAFTGIRLKPGESIEVRAVRTFRWTKS